MIDGLPARISGGRCFWQVLFADRDPVTRMDVLASDLERSKALDLALLRGGSSRRCTPRPMWR